MWKWLQRRPNPQKKPQESNLKGAPSSPRTKTYSANTGYVYQYVYRGYRQLNEENSGTEYIFSATRDRRSHFPITVRLLDSEAAECAQAAGRELVKAEYYALAKMTLFEALDWITDVADFNTPLVPDGPEMERHLRTLGRI